MDALSHPSVRRALLKPSPAAPSDLVPANRRACHLSTTHFTFRPRSRRARCPYCEPPIPRRLTPTERAAAWPRRGWCPRRARKKAPRPRNKAPYRTRRRSPTSAQCRLDPRSVGSALRTPQGSGWGRCADVGGAVPVDACGGFVVVAGVSFLARPARRSCALSIPISPVLLLFNASRYAHGIPEQREQ